MKKETSNREPRTDALKNESTRQRWDLFHQAIAHAKETNESDMKSACAEVTRRPVSLESVAS